MAAYFEKVIECNAKIVEAQEKVAILKGGTRCKYCGRVNNAGATFCMYCGPGGKYRGTGAPAGQTAP